MRWDRSGSNNTKHQSSIRQIKISGIHMETEEFLISKEAAVKPMRKAMRHRSELGVNSEQHQTDIEVILQRRRNEIEFNVVEGVRMFLFLRGEGCGGFAL